MKAGKLVFRRKKRRRGLSSPRRKHSGGGFWEAIGDFIGAMFD